jgi:primosomal protein N' (replication factor Y)
VSGVRVVRVLPDLAALGRPFDYEVPAGWEADVGVGTRVRISLNGRRVGGWVVEDDVDPTERETKPLAKVTGMGPPAPVIALAEWAAWRWAGPLTAVLTVASPERAIKGLPRPPQRTGVARPAAGDEIGLHASAALADVGRPTLLRIPPATDLIAVVEQAIGGTAGPVLVLVPNVGWADRLRARLHRRGIPAATSWAEAAAGWPVVVGSRGAAFSPMGRLGAAVVLDAHDESYREERSPHFDASLVVAERAARDGAPCLFTSATPTAVQVTNCRVVESSRDLERSGWPMLHVIDRRGADPRTGLYSEDLVRVARGVGRGRFIAVLNRRGRGRLLACASCGELVRCERCGRSMSEHEGRLRCGACAAQRPVVCAACGHTRLKVLRVGVARVREELAALLGVEVAEVSGPDDAPVPDTQVLVGTEAVLHRVRRAEVVAFLDFDMHLLAPRLSAGEEALALLARAGRLVGGRAAAGAGLVVVQTRLPDHEVLTAATAGNPGPFLDHELALRRELSLPPNTALAELSGPGSAEFFVALGIPGAPIDDDRWMVRAADHQELCDRLAATPRPRERVRVKVDPTGL